MTTRVSFLLLIIVLATVTLAGTQGLATFKSSNDLHARNDALQSFTNRAHSAFPEDEVAKIFAAMDRSEDEVLKMYDDFSTIPFNKRKASFRNASPDDKSNLWRAHLALFLVKRPELDKSQKEIILTAMRLARPEHFAVLSSETSWKTKVRTPLRALEKQIVSSFSLGDAAKIFATLGDDTGSASATIFTSSILLKNISYKPLREHRPWTHNRSVQDLPVEGPSCSCSTQSDWCPISSACNGGNCTGTSSGCGTLWSWPCNGGCR